MVRKTIHTAITGLFIVAAVLPIFMVPPASAAQLASRSIKLSNSTPGAAYTGYNVGFTASGSFQSLIIDFCADSPIIGSASCTTPTGMDASNVGLASTNASLGTISFAGSSAYRIKISGTTPQAAGAVTIALDTIVNPSSTGTFYARIYTYSNASFGTPTAYSSTGAPGSFVDYGGIAISTATTISLSATVMETLTFCVSGQVSGAPPTTCGSTTSPGFSMGSGSPVTLGTTLTTNNIYMLTSTNALSGVSIAMKNNNACGGLSRDGGTTCPVAPVGATAAVIANGGGKFGMYLGTSTGQTGASVAPAAPYDQGGSSKYGMDNTTAGNNVGSLYGDIIASGTGPTANALSTVTFGAAAANTTPAGVYSATMVIIATGTF